MTYSSLEEYLQSHKDLKIEELKNKIKLKGEVSSRVYSTSKNNSCFLKVYGKNGHEDEFKLFWPANVSFDVQDGDYVEVNGELRTMNKFGKLFISVKVNQIDKFDEMEHSVEAMLKDKNKCYVIGYLAKNPSYNLFYNPCQEKTEVTEGLIAVNHEDENESSYIPYVTFGQDAFNLKDFKRGDKVLLEGKFQARQYTKKSEPGKVFTAFEVNAKNIVDLNENNCNLYK